MDISSSRIAGITSIVDGGDVVNKSYIDSRNVPSSTDQDGKVLSVSDGSLSWEPLSGSSEYTTPGTYSFQIPSSAKEIFIQATGAGGAGESGNSSVGSIFDGNIWFARTTGSNNLQVVISSDTVDGKLYVAGGNSGELSTSTDAIAWTKRTIGRIATVQRIVKVDGDDYLISTTTGGSSSGGDISKSSDAIHWESIISNSPYMYALDYLNGLYIASGQSGFTIVSTDSIVWQPRTTTGEYCSRFGLAYGNGIYIIAGTNANRITKSTDTIHWENTSVDISNDWNSAIYANGSFLVGGNGSLISSTDSIVWTLRTISRNDTGSGTTIEKLHYDNDINEYFAVGISGGGIHKSTDSIAWEGVGENDVVATTYYDIVSDDNLYLLQGTTRNYYISSKKSPGYGGGAGGSGAHTSFRIDREKITGSTITVDVGQGGTGGTLLDANAEWQWGIRTQPTSLASSDRGVYAQGYYFVRNIYSTDTIVWEETVGQNGYRNNYYLNGLFFSFNYNGELSVSTDIITWTIRTIGTDTTAQTFIYENGNYLFAGPVGSNQFGALMHSTDTVTWTARTTSLDNPKNIIYLPPNATRQALYVLGEQSTSYAYSTDSVVWTPSTTSSSLNTLMRYDEVNDELWIVRNGSNNISTDGLSWDSSASSNFIKSTAVLGVEYADGTYIVTHFGDNSVSTSTDRLNWTKRTFTGNVGGTYASPVFYGASKWIAIQQSNPRRLIVSSRVQNATDGTASSVSWDGPNNRTYTVSANAGGGANGLSSGTGASANNNLNLLENSDGLNGANGSLLSGSSVSAEDQQINFQPTGGGAGSNNSITGGSAGRLQGIIDTTYTDTVSSNLFNGNNSPEYLAPYGGGGGGGAAPTLIGDYWSAQVLVYSTSMNAATSANGIYLVGSNTSDNSTGVLASTDAIVWTRRTVDFSGDAKDLKYANGFYSISWGNTIVGNLAVSTDTTVWEQRTTGISGGTGEGSGIIYVDGLYVYSHYKHIAVSTDTIHWTLRTTGAVLGVSWRGLNYNTVDGVYYATNDNGSEFFYSTDTISWQSAEQGDGYEDIIYSYDDNIYVVVGNSSRIAISTDGLSWTRRTGDGTINLNSVAYSNGIYVAVGDSGRIYRSTDTIAWIQRTENPNNFNRYNFIYSGDGLFIAGDTARIYTSIASVGGVGKGGNGFRGGGGGGGGFLNVSKDFDEKLSSWTIQTTAGTDGDSFATIDARSFVTPGIANWSLRTSGITTTIQSSSGRKNGQGTYALVLGTDVLHSTDSIHWVLRTSQGSYNSSIHPGDANNNITTRIADSIVFDNNRFDGDVSIWSLRTSGLTSVVIREISYANQTTFITGNSGVMSLSTDAIHWVARTAGTSSTIYDVVYSSVDDLYLSGEQDNVIISTDTIVWEQTDLGTSPNLITSVNYVNNIYIVGGTGGMMRTSTDAIVWETRDTGGTNQLGRVIYQDNQYLLAAANDTIKSSTDTVVWDDRDTGTTTGDFFSLVFGGGLYVADGGAFGTLITSTDSVVWTQRTIGFNSYVNDVTYRDVYVITGNDEFIAVSTDTIVWTARTSNILGNLTGNTYVNNLFIAAGADGTIATSPEYAYGIVPEQHIAVGTVGKIDTSTDSIVWELRTSGVLEDLNSVDLSKLVNGSEFIAPQSTSVIGGGTQWTLRTLGSSQTAHEIEYGNGYYVAAYSTLHKSTDSIHWSLDISPGGTGGTFRGIAFNPNGGPQNQGLFVVTDFEGGFRTSTDALNWSIRSGPDTDYSIAVAYDSTLDFYVAIGNFGKIIASTDSIHWVYRTSFVGNTLQSISSANGIYLINEGNQLSTDTVHWDSKGSTGLDGLGEDMIYDTSFGWGVVGQSGRVATSTDTIVWERRTSGTTSNLNNVVYNLDSSKYIAVADNSRILQSTDFISWETTQINSTQSRNYESLVYNSVDRELVIAGSGGNILSTISYDRLGYFPQEPFVAVGDKGKILCSTDEVHWTSKTAFLGQSAYDLKSVSWSYERQEFFVGGGYDFAPANQIWTLRTSGLAGVGSNSSLSNINFYNNEFVVGGGDGKIAVSTDAIHWTARTTGASPLGAANVAFGNGYYLFNSNSTANQLWGSTDSITWQLRTSGFLDTLFSDCIFAEGLFFASAVDGVFNASTDTIHWEARTTGTTNNIDAINYVNNNYVFVGQGFTAGISTDSVHWNLTNPGSNFDNIDYLNGLYVVSAFANRVSVSTDFLSWTARTTPYSGSFSITSVSAVNNEFFITAINGSIAISTDSIAWDADRNTKTTENIQDVVYQDGVYYLAGNSGYVATSVAEYNDSVLITSTDCVNWFLRTSTIDSDFVNGIDYSATFNQGYIAVGGGYLEGTLWTLRTSGTTDTSFAALFANDVYLIGTSGTTGLQGSTDTIHWESRNTGQTSPAPGTIRSLNYYNNVYTLSSASGMLLVSTDSTVWVARTTGILSDTIYAVAYSSGVYVLASSNNIMKSSTDTIVWESIDTGLPGSDDIYDVSYLNNLYVAVGTTVLLTSTNSTVWTARTTSISAGNTPRISYGNNSYVLKPTEINYVMASTDATTWVARTTGLQQFAGDGHFDIVYNDIFVISNTDGYIISTDAIVWSLRTNPIFNTNTAVGRGLTFSNNLFLSAGNDGAVLTSPVFDGKGSISQSSDGIHWTARTSSIDSRLNLTSVENSLERAGNLLPYVVTAATTPNNISIEPFVNPLGISKVNVITSLDGTEWTSRFTGSSSNLYSVLDLGNINSVNVVGDSGTIISAPSIGTFNNLPTEIVATGNNQKLAVSTDAIHWTLRTTGVTFTLSSLTYAGDGKLYAVAPIIPNAVATSTDTISWYYNDIPLGNPSELAYSEHDANQFILGCSKDGGGGFIYGATDGINWQLRTSDIGSLTSNLTSVSASNQYFLASDTSKFGVSTDTIVWTIRTVPSFGPTVSFSTIIDYINGYYFASTISGNISVSTDSIAWTVRTLFVGNVNKFAYSSGSNLYAIAFNNGYISTSTDTVVWNNNLETETSLTYDLNGLTSFYSPVLGEVFIAGGNNAVITSSVYDTLSSPEISATGDGGDGYVRISWW